MEMLRQVGQRRKLPPGDQLEPRPSEPATDKMAAWGKPDAGLGERKETAFFVVVKPQLQQTGTFRRRTSLAGPVKENFFNFSTLQPARIIVLSSVSNHNLRPPPKEPDQ
jgi:hypothetical protein